MTPVLRNGLRWVALGAAIFLATRLLQRQLDGVDLSALVIEWEWMAAAFVVNLLYVALYAHLWQRLAGAMGLALPRREAWGIYFSALAGKYLPLRVAGMGYRLWSYTRRGGWPVATVAGGLYFETVLVLVSGGIVVAALSPWVEWRAAGFTTATWIGSALVIVALVLAPLALPLLARRFPSRAWLQGVADTGRSTGYLRFIGYYTGAWLVLGLGLLLTMRGLGGPISPGSWINASWSYAVAGLAGMIVVVAPAGLGVRDGILALLLATAMPPAQAALCAIAARLLIVLPEMLCAAIGGWLLQEPRKARVSHS